MKTLLKLSIFILVLFSLGCSNDDSKIDDSVHFLPKVIRTVQSYDANPQYSYTYITYFEYDDNDRVTQVSKETYRSLVNDSKDVLISKDITNFNYLLTQNMIEQTYVFNNHEYPDSPTITNKRVYNITSGGSKVIITINDKKHEEMEISNGLVSKYSGYFESLIPEKPIEYFVKEYKYNSEGEIIQDKVISDDLSFVNQYTYDKFVGVYKHINIPQWLFIHLPMNEYEGKNRNIVSVSYLSEQAAVASSRTKEYKYNKYGYPEQMQFKPDPEIFGIWGYKTTFEYVKAKRQPEIVN